MELRHKILIAAAVSAASVACGSAAGVGGSADPKTETTQQPLEALIPLQGCGEVETYLRERLVADVNREIDDRIALVKKQEYGACYTYFGGAEDAAAGAPSNSSSSSSSSGSSGSSGGGTTGATKTSTTNNQVAGVDEADFIKNDNKYLYVVANKTFRIVQAWPADQATQVAKIDIDGEPRKLFVEGNRALIYVAVPRPVKTATTNGGSSSSSSSGGSSGGYAGGSTSECTYGYDCVPSGDGTQTKILVFDITNRANPTKQREITLSGSLLSARRIGNAVHTVVVEPYGNIEGLEHYLDPNKYTCDSTAPLETQKQTAIANWESLRAANLAKVAAVNVMETIPSAKENGGDAVAACAGYFRPNVAEGTTFTTLFSIDMGENAGNATSATVISDPGVTYASETGLYMAVPHQKTDGYGWYGDMAGEEQASTVHKFRVGATPTLTGYEASGIVKGRVLNQFSLDEWQGHLRVATTTGHTPDPKVHSTMSVLERKDKALVLTGKVDNIAPTEDIRSVRFDGSRGFVVTFKKTDPLYVFDLGNPSLPSIAGELKIPGFSTYMHMMDAQHLLTIGYDADDQGSFAWFAGVRLQIFDVSDMKNPQLAHTEIIGTRGSSSEALTNHLAFNYYAEKNLLALPMTICEGGSGGSFGTNMTFSGLLVYDVTTQTGFTKHGAVAHPNNSSGTGYENSACSNWWTNASSEVKRSVIMDDVVYSVSERRVKVNNLANLSSDIATISLDN